MPKRSAEKGKNMRDTLRGTNRIAPVQANSPQNASASRPSRQQPPLSCQFCRSRKLRCNREQPCSSCVSRGISCQRSGAEPTGITSTLSTEDLVPTLKPSISNDLQSTSSDILCRLQRLENVVAVRLQRLDQLENVSPTQVNSSLALQIDWSSGSTGRSKTQDKAAASCTESPTRRSLRSQRADQTTQLEQVIIGQDQLIPVQNSGFFIRVIALRQIIDGSCPMVFEQSTISGYTSLADLVPCINLPSLPEADILLEKYILDINYLVHISHVPTLRSMLVSVYAQANIQENAEPGRIALLLSVFASTAYFWTERDSTARNLFENTSEASQQAWCWIKATQDLIHICQRRRCLSLEVVQAAVITSYVISNLEGISYSYRYLMNLAIMMGRELRLHRIDHPTQALGWTVDPIRAEIGRRVWWYLAATDWMQAARSAGNYEFAYQIHLRGMTVNIPRDCNDEDLVDGSEASEKLSSEATDMSYLLQRLRLADISRRLVDQKSINSTVGNQLSYSDILEADLQLDRLIDQIPSFFRFAEQQPSENSPRQRLSTPRTVIQRYFVNSLFQSHRCRLHLPYLVRSSEAESHNYSRATCLGAARLVIGAELQLEREKNLPFVQTHLKQTGILYSVFIASIALFMDLLSQGLTTRDELRRGDFGQALRILEAAGRQSSVAADLLQTMTSVMQKHNILQHNQTFGGATEDTIWVKSSGASTPSSISYSLDSRFDSGQLANNMETNAAITLGSGSVGGEYESSLDLASHFDEFATNWASSATTLSAMDWDSMLSEFDSVIA